MAVMKLMTQSNHFTNEHYTCTLISAFHIWLGASAVNFGYDLWSKPDIIITALNLHKNVQHSH